MWHMHQPDYRVPNTGVYQQPWTYLHAIKDYVDMAMHLEANSKAKVIVNFTPVLLEQIDDYAHQLTNYLNNATPITDPLLNALTLDAIPNDAQRKLELIEWCSRAHEENAIKRYQPYQELIDIVTTVKQKPNSVIYLSQQFFFDLLVWYHIVWLAENVQRNDIRVKRLISKKEFFDATDRRELITLIHEIITSIIPRYRKLAESKQIELSTTPYTHPIIPLLIDLKVTKQAMPDAPLPDSNLYPEGEVRARWHVENSINIFEHYFGFKPVGCWPSEGAVSEASTKLIQDYGFEWLATGQGVFHNSVNSVADKNTHEQFQLNRPNQLSEQKIHCFFRDDGLSDLIGFEYSKWHADDAVANFIHHLTELAKQEEIDDDSIVSVILDGENAWEHYPMNGYYFLGTLYKELADHPNINLITFADYLAQDQVKPQKLPALIAGSWVYGTLSTWIGSQDKNMGWDMLCDAKQCYDETLKTQSFTQDELVKIDYQLAVCESSDWFWWFGDYNSEDSVSDFEKMYRNNLNELYKLLKQPAPEYLEHRFTYGQGSPEGGGSMRRGGGSH